MEFNFHVLILVVLLIVSMVLLAGKNKLIVLQTYYLVKFVYHVLLFASYIFYIDNKNCIFQRRNIVILTKTAQKVSGVSLTGDRCIAYQNQIMGRRILCGDLRFLPPIHFQFKNDVKYIFQINHMKDLSISVHRAKL